MTTRSFVDLLNVADNLRKLATLTVETYPNPWKVVHETLQNAKDAIRRANHPGKIDIVLDVTSQPVTVLDNGTGFPIDDSLWDSGA